ncbi:MAG: riboflavin biosynthesis protein RibD [Candidatus Magasanikbacteria bacterium RIFCSPHIGHO2_02_FULL_51_14]|uniref:Riboflavin biosynthesis protein RibD n=1 Tax=Candidatus Magasanikbacteria bacterium RIFCSPHIGHO2_02_FULL_51_14 TaxID=1798683 RepID=A0A1F6MDJ0_9BACT|nr:MAG: riboflavin biosynthesis protein RibD [Candidatus Magasanikbacteria bacterium RIFCSPHIGHO2_02_FULL_51_14]
MHRAYELARKGIGFTSPNPAVGAVIVKNGKIIGEGWHKKAGGKHAEVIALRQAQGKLKKSKGKGVKGSTLYVTLEPCCHFGQTPPCVDAIISSGIKKVVVGMKDPHKKVDGGGIRALRKAGIVVELLNTKSVLAKEIRMLNQPFIKWAMTGFPYVVLKAAVSLDGKIATRTGESKWITGLEAREDARLERSLCDAVFVGAGTVHADNPELAAHGKFRQKKLLRVIIDGNLSTSRDFRKKVFRDEHVFVACADMATKKNQEKFRRAGIPFQSFGRDSVSVKKLLHYLGRHNIQSVFVEGGAGIHGAFHDSRMIDKVIFYIAPKIIGGIDSLSAVGGEGVKKMSEAAELKEVQVDRVGSDVKIVGQINVY